MTYKARVVLFKLLFDPTQAAGCMHPPSPSCLGGGWGLGGYTANLRLRVWLPPTPPHFTVYEVYVLYSHLNVIIENQKAFLILCLFPCTWDGSRCHIWGSSQYSPSPIYYRTVSWYISHVLCEKQ